MEMDREGDIRWIDVGGGVAEQMLRYVHVMSLRRRGFDARAVMSDGRLFRLFPDLPQCPTRRRGLLNWMKRAGGDGEPMSYEDVEALGDDLWRWFDLCPARTPAAYSGLISQFQSAVDTVAVHMLKRGRGTCTRDYYNWAIAGLRQWIDRPRFIVVTDNAGWAKGRLDLEGDDVRLVELPARAHGLVFAALRHAGHLVLSDTLSSWWGAWLCANPDKIIVAPKPWSAGDQSRLIPLHWISIPTT